MLLLFYYYRNPFVPLLGALPNKLIRINIAIITIGIQIIFSAGVIVWVFMRLSTYKLLLQAHLL
tara:strand:+ start:835 stop:1026 length:192 start_codon:yes stop_codon:yes gene_type:complete